MENVTPQQAMTIIILALIAMSGSIAYQCRASIAAAFRRYVEVRRPVPADDYEADADETRVPVLSQNGRAQPPSVVQPGTASHTGTVVVHGISRTMKPVEIIAVLAVQRDEQGRYWLSADRIARCVGGTRGDVLALVKAIRGTDMRAEHEERAAVIRHEQTKLADLARKAS